MDIEKILKEIWDKEKEVWIINSYYWWGNDIYERLYEKGYNNKEVYNEVVSRNLKKKRWNVAPSYKDIMKTMGNIDTNDIATVSSWEIYVYRWEDKEYCNEEYCIEHNIPIVDLWQKWGSIVVSPSDFGFWFSNIPSIEWQYVLDKVSEYLWGGRDGNDLMIDGYKVWPISTSWKYRIMHLSFDVDLDLIKNICKKESGKIPWGIKELRWIDKEVFRKWLKTRLIN